MIAIINEYMYQTFWVWILFLLKPQTSICFCSFAGTNTSDVKVHLDYEPLGMRPLLGEAPNPNLSAAQQAVRLPSHCIIAHSCFDMLACNQQFRRFWSMRCLKMRIWVTTQDLIVWRAHPQASGPCNLGMPNGASVYDRFFWYLRLFTYNGFVVLLDNHLNADPTITLDADLWLSVCHCSCVL